jgi:hypothetical protein
VAVGDAEEFEGPPLQRGGGGDHGECRHVVVGLNLVGTDGGQVGQQAGEAVHGGVVVGAFMRGFLECLVRALGGGDGVGPFGCGGGFVVVLEQDWCQGLFHVPAEVVGQHPQEQVGTDPVGQPMPDGPHIEFAVEGAEEPLDRGEKV